MKISNRLPTFVVIAIAVMLIFVFTTSSKVKASANNVMAGKCVAMATTSSFVLNNNTSESEISWIGILNFDDLTYSTISAEINRPDTTVNRRVDKDRRFYLSNEEISGMYRMRFSEDPSASDHIILVPSNANNTIFMMDPLMGSTGVCQKL